MDNEKEFIETLTVVKDTTAPELTFVSPTQDQATADDFTVLVHTNEPATCEYDLDS